MSRIQPRPRRDVGIISRLAYRYAESQYGMVPEPMAMWAHAPGVFWTWSMAETLAQYSWRRLPASIRDLAAIRAASVLGCAWCLDFGSVVARTSGVTQAKLEALHDWRSSDMFREDERVALAYADAMTETPVHASDELVARVRETFGDDGAVELTAVIALENQRSRFNHALGLTSQGFSREACAAPATSRSGQA